ncbi:heme-binding protein (plasmid) [Sphingobium sp. SCG-1]|uniref:GlcG/HbpS family heme-binding protein n=1 Tax=Sphingobium sp. SCG-1 TaxID=2072936 RepID=UPI000CD6A8EA|nr:heme-binding protein [Sphingobium sp. SCG-1]AUW60560.1 heme-binding protein [Sphingobium sp. SCG-1]
MAVDRDAETMFSPSAKLAARLVLAAVEHGASIGVFVAASVCDTTGRPVAALMHPKAPTECAAIARDKAAVSAGFRTSTDNLFEEIAGNEALKIGLATRRGFALFGGGSPITLAGDIIGGLGVSGGSEEQDTECLQFALKTTEFIGKSPVL